MTHHRTAPHEPSPAPDRQTDTPAPPDLPAVARHQLGTRLRQLRNARSLQLAHVASHLDIAPSTLSRIETGRAPTRTSYLNAILNLYGITDQDQRLELAGLARRGQYQHWWARCAGLLPEGTGTYLHYEAAATGIAIHAPHIIPGLAQTTAYATACASLTNPALADDDANLIAAIHTDRTACLRHDHHLHLIIDETALRRPVVPPDAMAAQLRHLLHITAALNVTLQITTPAYAPPVPSPPFTLLTFPDPHTPAITCYHGPAGHIILTRRAADTHAARTTIATLAQAALPPEDSANLIRNLAHPGRQPKNPALPR